MLALLFLFAAPCDAGLTLLRQGDLPAATAALARAAPPANDALCWKALGVALAQQNRHDEAEPAFRQACSLNAREPDACYFWGRSLYALDRFEQSLAALRQAQPHDSQPGRIHAGLGQALMALGRSPDAERELRAAVKLDPQRHSAALGSFLLREGRAEEAIAVLQPAASFDLARAYLQANRPQDAVTVLQQLLQRDPRHAPAQALLRKARARLATDPPAHP